MSSDFPVIIKEIKKGIYPVTFHMSVEDRRPDLKEGSDEIQKMGYKYKNRVTVRIFWIKIKILFHTKTIPFITINEKYVWFVD